MNLNLAVVGPARVGKTLFCINFAEYLGAKNLCYTEAGPHGRGKGVVTPETARNIMVASTPRRNGVVRSFAVNLLHQETMRLVLVDTASLKEETPLPKWERVKLAETMQALQESDAVLYLVDLPCTDPDRIDFALKIHYILSGYCMKFSKHYLLGGTKKDLISGGNGALRHFFSQTGKIVPVSSFSREGFADLRRLLLPDPARFAGRL